MSKVELVIDFGPIDDLSFQNTSKPLPNLLISDWADEYREIPRGSSEPGRWKTSRTPYLKEIMDTMSPQNQTQKCVVIKGTQLGFALDINTDIPTLNGWRKMGDIKIGDKVFDELGNIVNVTYISPIYKNHKCFKVTFSDGSEIIADKDHRWAVDRYVGRTFKRYDKKIVTTYDMSLDFKHGRRNRYAIDVAKPLKTKNKIDIEPYLLGLWLANGNSYSNRITVDKKYVDEYLKILVDKNIKVATTDKHSKGNATEIIFYDVYPIIKKKIGIKKHIPMEILRADECYRRELLKGLIDGDGHITKDGYCEYYSVSKILINDVMELILTLGLKPTLRLKKQKSKGVINGRAINQPETIYVLTFKAYKKDNIARIKYNRLTDIKSGRPTETFRRRVINIEQIESVDVRCIAVDSKSHLFLASRNFIPTHNTEVGNNIMGYYMHIDPRSIGMWLPTDALAERHAKKKLWKMIETTPVLKEVVFPRNKGTGENSTITQLMFTGGSASIYGSNSTASYRSDSISVAIKDDIDGFIDDVEGEGSPIELIDNRTDSYANRKIYENSTPTIDGMSHIQTEFEESTQSEYYMPCPECTPRDIELQNKSNMVKFDLKHFKYDHKDYKLLSEVEFCCPHCGSLIKEYQKSWMMDYNNGARYIDKKEHKVKGFKVNSFYSPLGWTSWERIIEEYLKAKKKLKEGDDRLMKRFMNTRLAEVYRVMVKKTEADELKKLVVAIDEGVVPKDTWKLVMSVDVQGDHFWYEVRCLLYGVSYHVLQYGRAETWEDIENIMRDQYYDMEQRAYQVSVCAVDSGYRTDEVYEFCMENEDICIPVKGKTTMEARYQITTQERETYNIRLYTLNPNNFKDIYDSKLKRSLKLIEKGELSEKNVITFHAQSDATLYEQLTSEYRITVKNRGVEKFEWKRYKKDNHLFDCATYNTFLAELLHHRRQKRPTEIKSKEGSTPAKRKQRKGRGRGVDRSHLDNY